MTDHHIQRIALGFECIDGLARQIAEFDQPAGVLTAPLACQMEPQRSIPGVEAPAARQLLAFAGQYRLRAIYAVRLFVDAVGLLFYGPSRREITQRTAVFIDQVPKGAKPAGLAVQQPATFDLVVNLKTAQALGLTIPPSPLFQPTEGIR